MGSIHERTTKILTSGSGGELVQRFLSIFSSGGHLVQRSSTFLCNFVGEIIGEHSCETFLNLGRWFRMRYCLTIYFYFSSGGCFDQ